MYCQHTHPRHGLVLSGANQPQHGKAKPTVGAKSRKRVCKVLSGEQSWPRGPQGRGEGGRGRIGYFLRKPWPLAPTPMTLKSGEQQTCRSLCGPHRRSGPQTISKFEVRPEDLYFYQAPPGHLQCPHRHSAPQPCPPT